MKNFEIGTTIERSALKQIFGGDPGGGKTGGGGECTPDWGYDCHEGCPCCSALCETNATNTGTICVPIP